MKKLALITVLFSFQNSFACTFCNKQVSDAIYDSAFYPNLFTMLSAFVVLGIVVLTLSVLATRKYQKRLASEPGSQLRSPVPLATASMILGIGLGGFLDGIVLHQILQWHEMLSAKIPATDYVGKSTNMFWDGIFHLFCAVVVIIGSVLMWKLTKRSNIDTSGRLFSGGLLCGWALFNIIEGVVNHQILKLHNVFEQSPDHDTANYAFLGISVVMLVVGYLLINKRTRAYGK